MSVVGRNHPEWQTRISCTHCKTEQTKNRKDLFILTPGTQVPELLLSASVLSLYMDHPIVCCVCSDCDRFIVVDEDADGWLDLSEYQPPLISLDTRWYW